MDLRYDPSLVLYLPLYQLDGASLMSKDKHGHLATVTGATWGLQGRTFDGTDDYISVPNLFPALSRVMCVETWVRLDVTGTSRHIVVDSGWGAGGAWLLGISATNVPGFTVRTTVGDSEAIGTALTLNTFTHLVALFDLDGDAKAILYQNALRKTDGIQRLGTFGTANATWIGRNDANTWKGLIGEVRCYTRAPSVLEIQHIYLATKWRYQ